MNERDEIETVLDRLGEGLGGGSQAPTRQMLDRGSEHRRRRTRGIAAGGVALALAIGTGAWVLRPSSPITEPVVATGPSEPAPARVPTGFRLHGLLGVGVVVPEGWGDGATLCNGVPERNTFAINHGWACAMASQYPANTRMVTLGTQRPLDTGSASTRSLGEWTGELSPVICTEQDWPGAGDVVTLCSQTWFIEGVAVEVTSSRANARADLAQMLSWVRALPEGATGLPSWQQAMSSGQEKSGERFRRRLAARGLDVEVRRVLHRGLGGGYLQDMHPAAGNVVRAGDRVTLEVTAEPTGPADEISIDVNTESTREGVAVTDEQLRAGHTLTVEVGEDLWGYGTGRWSNTLQGTVTSGAEVLEASTWSQNLGRSWRAVRSGTAEVEFWIMARGRKVVLGHLTVRVR